MHAGPVFATSDWRGMIAGMIDKEEAQKEIQKLVADAYAALEKAKALCDEHALTFTFAMGYPGGGEYVGTGASHYDDYDAPDGIMQKGRWVSSSENC